MARRYFEFNNFRNLGLEDNTDNKIVINNCLEKGKLGNLVILIGANNSGKSNVLDGILEYGNSCLSNRDITTLSFNETDRNPSVKLVYDDDNIHFEKELKKDNKKIFRSNFKNMNNNEISTKEIAINSLQIVFDYAKNCFNSNQYIIKELESLINDINKIGFFNINHRNRFYAIYNELKKDSNYSINRDLINKILSTELAQIVFNSEKNGLSYIEDTYGYGFEPKIIQYKELQISSSDMNCSINNLKDNLFFKSVFKAIGIDISEIINGYKQYQEFKNPASLNKIRKMIDKKIEKLNEQFNKLYFAESDKYKFTIDIDTNNIGFGMARGENEDPIMIEMQSTGFRWFFNLYFNFICSNELKPGDIIIMDEPATNLHPEGQKELRSFIKKFAIENDLTFIIATHSPFLIDPDNYDELRLVSMLNNRSSIDNLFSAVNIEDPDSLLPIKDALTIKQNVLYDMDTEVVWVEGITDYNYLTMFKKFLNIKNISFIPYNGNGKNNDEMKQILKKLIDIKFFRCSILVDSDKSGKIMAKLCQETKFKDRIYQIGNVNSNLTEIEDLFSQEDKNKYESLNKKSELFKKSYYSSMMKTTTSIDDYSEETINNFKKLFEIICD